MIDLSKYYEIVIFTAALKKYADLVINSIDPNRVIIIYLKKLYIISLNVIFLFFKKYIIKNNINL